MGGLRCSVTITGPLHVTSAILMDMPVLSAACAAGTSSSSAPGVAATLGLSPALGVRIANAATDPSRPPVIWLSGQACTGCTESLLRANHPTIDTLILDMISLDYHETLAAGAGAQAENYKDQSMKRHWGSYVLVVDGAVPTKDGGIYCKVAGETFLELGAEGRRRRRRDHRHGIVRVVGRHPVERAEPDHGQGGARGAAGQDHHQHARLPAQRLQPAFDRPLPADLRQGARSR